MKGADKGECFNKQRGSVWVGREGGCSAMAISGSEASETR